MDFKVKHIHDGQYKRYGDYFRVWEIETDCEDKEQVLDFCFTELYKKRVPSKAEWSAEIRMGSGSHAHDPYYYFAGYYTLTKIENGYEFKICEPFAD